MSTDSVYHPIQKDRATFLETFATSRGTRTLIAVELAPAGGNSLHYHSRFSERFEVVTGELLVQVDRNTVTLGPGGTAEVGPGTPHRFFNPTPAPTTFRVDLQPAHEGFENALRIAYGLAHDGRVNAKGIPSNLLELAVLATMADTVPTGLLAAFTKVFALLAATRRGALVRKQLIGRYCPPPTTGV